MTAIVIPARIGSTRLPNKALARIGDERLVVHCWRRAIEADVGPVFVATDSREIVDVISDAGGDAVMIVEAATGTDRVAAAIAEVDPNEHHSLVMNLQGDMPFISPHLIRAVAVSSKTRECDMLTAAQVYRFVDATNGTFRRMEAPRHIGIYLWHRDALKRFASLPQSPREIEESLEQLRAVDAGMRIGILETPMFPAEINYPNELDELRKLLEMAS